MFLVPHVLYITSHLIKKIFLLSHSNMSLWDIIALKKGINISLLIFIGILCLLTSFFELVPYYTIVHSNDNTSNCFPTTINLPSWLQDNFAITQDVSPAHFQTNQCCSQLVDIPVQDPSLTNNDKVEAMSYSSSIPSSQLDLFTSKNDWPITNKKVIRSTVTFLSITRTLIDLFVLIIFYSSF